jgi:transcriptional regulator with XRE-family HTH domain
MRSKGKASLEFDHFSTSKEIGARLRSVRLNLGLSQIEVGNMLGVAYQQIQKYECGSSQISVTRLIQFCQTFKIDLNTILSADMISSDDRGPSLPLKSNATLASPQ